MTSITPTGAPTSVSILATLTQPRILDLARGFGVRQPAPTRPSAMVRDAWRARSKADREKVLDEPNAAVKQALKEAPDDESLADALVELASGGKSARERHRARTGQLVLQPTASRRSTGSHYTPRSLSEKVVRRTLEPILACLGEAPTAREILGLKVCDPAMGSGAFLVEACRFLGDAVVSAWRRSGELTSVVEAHGDPLLHAKRLVAQRCLYGVDKNAAAVELAKLSLWLETLSGDHAFTFLDHVLRHGDSLVGLDVAQVRAFHWSPAAQLETVAPLVDRALSEVREHRDAIHALADDEGDFAQREKRRLLELADQAMERVKLVADVCVGAFFAEGKPKAREAERVRRLKVVESYLRGEESATGQIEEWAGVIRKQHAPFHWHLELPEVFFLERADPLAKGERNRAAFVDAFVGNPPFMGGSTISSNFGDSYRDWLLSTHEGAHGNADLSADFFRRAADLLGAHGALGLIATNTIAQGDTRATGLQHLVVDRGFTLYDATRSVMWPGVAAVSVSIAHLATGAPRRLTQTYNKLKDPACGGPPIVALRRMHEEMDRAVLSTYGWTDIVVPPFCPKTPEDQGSIDLFQDEVIDHLFVLNAERAEEERRLGTLSTSGSPTTTTPRKRKTSGATRQKTLFDENRSPLNSRSKSKAPPREVRRREQPVRRQRLIHRISVPVPTRTCRSRSASSA